MGFVVWAIAGLVLFVPRLLRRVLFSLRRPRVLKYELEGEVVFQKPRRRWLRPARRVVALDRLDEEWTAIATDPKVASVIVVFRALRGGFVAALALYERLLKLREKKRVVVYAPHLSNRDFVIAAGATAIAMPPSGGVHLTGIGVEVTHLRAFLAQASVKVEVDAAGKYKGALERFTRDDLSAPQREVLDAMLDSWSGDFAARIAEGRGRTNDEVATWIAHGPYTSEAARAAGLIDQIAYEEDLCAKTERSGTPIPPKVLPKLPSSQAIAVVTMKGLIHMGVSRPFPSLTVGESTVRAAFKKARENRSVRGVLLAIDSGGGSALASDLIWDEVARTCREKPVVAWMGNVAASGGYYAAAPATEIVASPFTLTGSIGVISGRFILSDLFRRFGITRTLVARGRFAELDSLGQPLSDEARAVVQSEVADCYERFLSRVAEGRKIPLAEVRTLAEGRVYTGRNAAAHRLVDHLGDFSLAVQRLRALATAPRARLVLFDPAASPFARGDRTGLVAEIDSLARDATASFMPDLLETATIALHCDGAPLALAPEVYSLR